MSSPRDPENHQTEHLQRYAGDHDEIICDPVGIEGHRSRQQGALLLGEFFPPFTKYPSYDRTLPRDLQAVQFPIHRNIGVQIDFAGDLFDVRVEVCLVGLCGTSSRRRSFSKPSIERTIELVIVLISTPMLTMYGRVEIGKGCAMCNNQA